LLFFSSFSASGTGYVSRFLHSLHFTIFCGIIQTFVRPQVSCKLISVYIYFRSLYGHRANPRIYNLLLAIRSI
jgi:hypothetical protein